MGLLVGTTFYPVISSTKRHRLVTWTFRLIAMPLAIILFVVLIRNFYTSNPYAGALLLQSIFTIGMADLLQLALGVVTCHASQPQQITTVKGKIMTFKNRKSY